MKLHGQEVPQSVIDAANAAMVGRFTVDDVDGAIWRATETEPVLLESLTNELIRSTAKAGKIRYEGGYWHEVE